MTLLPLGGTVLLLVAAGAPSGAGAVAATARSASAHRVSSHFSWRRAGPPKAEQRYPFEGFVGEPARTDITDDWPFLMFLEDTPTVMTAPVAPQPVVALVAPAAVAAPVVPAVAAPVAAAIAAPVAVAVPPQPAVVTAAPAAPAVVAFPAVAAAVPPAAVALATITAPIIASVPITAPVPEAPVPAAPVATPVEPETPPVVGGWHQSLAAVKLTITASFVLKALCIGSNIIYQASPMPTAREFAKAGDTGEADSAPLVSIAFSCTQFSFYGTFAFMATGKSGFLVLVYSNALGLIMGFYYVYAYMSNCHNPANLQKTWKYLKFIAVCVLGQMISTYFLPTGRALLLVGLVSSTCSMVSAVSLVTTVPEVFRTKCSKSLPVAILVCGEVSGVLWVLCGLMLADVYIILPNVVCLIISTFALILTWYFPSGADEDEGASEFVQQPLQVRRSSNSRRVSYKGAASSHETTKDYGSMSRINSYSSHSGHSASKPASIFHRRTSSAPPEASPPPVCSSSYAACAGTGEADYGETGGTPSPPMLWPMSPEPSDDEAGCARV
mmetsp:Transcript_164890/g.529233  ORF Transcript_164890/g.529233 Transcript_164890/m.529233 type:complete len:555 (-) Transcript_164890:150-1814(-)